jgi:hypothetical protein
MRMHGLAAVSERIGAIATHQVVEKFARTWQTILNRELCVALYDQRTAVGVLPCISAKECEDITTTIVQAPRDGHTLFIKGFGQRDVTAMLQMGCTPGDPGESLDKHIARSTANQVTVTAVSCSGQRY